MITHTLLCLGVCSDVLQMWTWPSSGRRTRSFWMTTTCCHCCTWQSTTRAKTKVSLQPCVVPPSGRSYTDTQNLLSQDETSVVCSSHVSNITPFFPSRVNRPQGWKHASAGHFPSWGPAHRLGSPGPHLQGEVAAAHPLHAGRPGEVSAPSDSSLENLLVLFLLRWLTVCVCVCLCLRYNVVFRYLLSVRRVQSQLQHCWALQMQRKHLKSTKTDAVKWRLRNHMAFLVDNLQYYLQVITWPVTRKAAF